MNTASRSVSLRIPPLMLVRAGAMLLLGFFITSLCANRVYSNQAYSSLPRSDDAGSPSPGFEPTLERSAAASPVRLATATTVPARLPPASPLGAIQPRGDSDDVAELALKISYAGAILLTADRIWRSVDSLLESMVLEGHDGEEIRFVCAPAPHGVDVQVRITRPIDF